MTQLFEWIRHAGGPGVVLFALAFVVATLLLVPASIPTMAAGYLFGVVGGTVVAVPAMTIAAVLALLLGRTVLRDWSSESMRSHPRLAALERAVQRDGFKLMVLLRLSPVVPFPFLNYALAATRVRLRDYFVATLFGILPATLVFVYVGSLITSVHQLVDGDLPTLGLAQDALYWGGLPCTALAVALLMRTARKALHRTWTDGTI